MHFRRIDAIGVGTVLLLAGLLGVSYPALPEPVVTHWNAANDPDGTMSRPLFVGFSLAVAAGTYGVLRGAPRLDSGVDETSTLYRTIVALTMGFLLAMDAFVVAWNVGYRVPVGVAVALGTGAFVAALGTAMVRFDAAAASGTWPTESAHQSHVGRIVGRSLQIAGGVALVALVVPEHATVLVLGGVTVVPLAGVAYAFMSLPDDG